MVQRVAKGKETALRACGRGRGRESQNNDLAVVVFAAGSRWLSNAL